jgi:hypothetical protein
MCASKAPKEEKVNHQEQMKPSKRWIEISVAAKKYLVVKIADAGHRPDGDFAGAASLGKPEFTLFYVLIPDAAGAADVGYVSGGSTIALAKPKKIFRMPGSALFTAFITDPANPGSLAFKAGGKETVVALSSQALQALPFFWSGEPASVAFEEIPGWMEGSGP